VAGQWHDIVHAALKANAVRLPALSTPERDPAHNRDSFMRGLGVTG
jgi:hypothetical protein